MERTEAKKKRGRTTETTSPAEKISPPNKRNTRSASRLRLGQRPLTQEITTAEEIQNDIIDLSDEPDTEMASANREVIENDAAKVKNISDMAKLFVDKISVLPTKEYMDQRLGQIDIKVDRNRSEIDRIRERVETLERSDPPRSSRLIVESNAQTSQRTSAIELARDEEFEKACRSVRLWPISGQTVQQMTQSVEDFLQKALLMDEADLEMVIIEQITRVRSSPRAKQYDEVLVLFRETGVRETILSYARNLNTYIEGGQPTAGIRMEIPRFLQATYRLLDTYGWEIRQKNGKETRRIIKFDHIERNLYLTYRLPYAEDWLKVTPAMARTHRDRENQKSLLHFSNSLSPPGLRRMSPAPLTGSNTLPVNSLRTPANCGEIRSNQTWQPPPRRQSTASSRQE